MSTVTTTVNVANIGTNTTTGVTQPEFKVSAQVLLHDFWDTTNKRYRSGVIVTVITSISWTGTKATGETATVTINAPNYEQDCNDQQIYSPIITSASPMSPNFKHVTAINYGQPDSSAVLGQDGTISLVDVVFDLNANAFTPIASFLTVSVTYTTTFTEYSPYSAISGGTNFTAPLAIGNGSSADWGMAINAGTTGYAALVVQLTSLQWSVLPGDAPIGMVPNFQLSNPARQGGAVVANYNTTLAQSFGRTLTYFDY
jgi:hypothetical protein